MHKKLEAELVSLANSILDKKNNEDILSLHKKSQELYEKLTILKFVENNLNVEAIEKQEVVENIPAAVVEKVENVKIEESVIAVDTIEKEAEIKLTSTIENESVENEKIVSEQEKLEPNTIDNEFIEVEEDLFTEKENTFIEEEETEPDVITHSLEQELENAISADIATNLFERATKEEPVIEKSFEKVEEIIEDKKVSLNDSLFKDNIQVGLNDRIAFVKNLFDGSQEDFNRVLSQLNSFKTEKEAKSFLNKFVKPDYNWTNKEDYENRLVSLIERKFL
ncbi:hypothetical protein R3X25_05855 [Lutibacter sp. TH_r2]|uniref:hypothetical protein n=1 Tax=Lutibacter sp. TH_r2 TaxID=3082083 RepID=UPI002953A5CC|nr:hypothetical protein [Lutibacter sp. TH_r2]MDV7186801.1 hypothetical protein [Lutibacter sp. TH_r2]